jgi:C1A family cysteine protease
VGLGSEGGQNYWIARNFWGTAWGEEGFFRVKRGSNVLGIEKKCYWTNFQTL